MISVSSTLEEKDGFAFRHLEKSFWMDVLTITLKRTKGNASEASRILGISKATIISRAYMYDIDINEYREKEFKERKGKYEKHLYWKYLIKKSFTNEKVSVSEAARNLGWSRSTFYQRMKIVGITR